MSQDANGSGAYMDFAALLTLKGAKIDGGSLASIKFNPYYLEVPVRVGYKYAVNEDFSLFGSVGPYMAPLPFASCDNPNSALTPA